MGKRDHERVRTHHELFTAGTVMMSVRFNGQPTAETRAVFQEIVDKLASGEIEFPSSNDAGQILDVTRA